MRKCAAFLLAVGLLAAVPLVHATIFGRSVNRHDPQHRRLPERT